TRREIFLPPHPRTRPVIQATAITLQPKGRNGSAAVYGRGLLCYSFPRHGTDHDSKPLPTLSGVCLSSRPVQSGPEEYRGTGATPQGFRCDLLALPSAGAWLRSTARAAL